MHGVGDLEWRAKVIVILSSGIERTATSDRSGDESFFKDHTPLAIT
jgi:hypothetical protein